MSIRLVRFSVGALVRLAGADTRPALDFWRRESVAGECSAWILAAGAWDDDGLWLDGCTWSDG